jgi:hypothetical protein
MESGRGRECETDRRCHQMKSDWLDGIDRRLPLRVDHSDAGSDVGGLSREVSRQSETSSSPQILGTDKHGQGGKGCQQT